MFSRRVLLLALALPLAACGDDDSGGGPDAAVDTTPSPDAGSDAPALMTIDDYCPGSPHCMGVGDGKLYVGVAKEAVNPELLETEWDDANGNHLWESTEAFTDVNGNGVFDADWIAGYNNGHPAQGVHDDLEARAIAMRWNDVHVAIAYIDCVGMFIEDIDDIKADPQLADLDLDHVIIGSTHDHDGIDTVGLWGSMELVSGVNPDHQAKVKSQAAKAIREAVMAEQAAHMRVVQVITQDPVTGSTLNYVGDQRDPVIYDPTLTLVQFTQEADPTATIGTIANWASHAQWVDTGTNPMNLTSADFPYWLRLGLEEGVPATGAGTAEPGIGGLTVFFQGPLGGQVGTEKVDPIGMDGLPMIEEGFPAAEAIGTNVARLGLQALSGPDAEDVTEELAISYRTAALFARVDNVYFQVLATLSLGNRQLFLYDPSQPIDENNVPYVRSRVTYLQVGPVATITAPGELNPELFVGGYEDPYPWSWGNDPIEEMVNTPDFAMAPQPPYLRDLMLQNPGVRYTFVSGLAEDFLGYIVAKFNFVVDPDAPYVTEAEGDHYEETNSVGPYAEEHLNYPMIELAKWRSP